MFPYRALTVSVGLGVLLLLSGIGGRTTLVMCFAIFMGMGGYRYAQLLARTLPRDLKYGWMAWKVIQVMKKYKKQKMLCSEILAQMVKRHPKKSAIVFEDQQWTFQDLEAYANKVANTFKQLGLQKGDRVALYVENCPEFIGLWLGLSKIGVISALMNTNIREEGLVHCFRITEPCAVVFSASLGDMLRAVLHKLDPVLNDKCFSIHARGTSSIPHAKPLEGLLKEASSSTPPLLPERSIHDLLYYIYTSGTTGFPKACIIKHSKFIFTGDAFLRIFNVTPKDTVYCPLPLYHSLGGLLAVSLMLLNGSTLVIRKRFSASNFWSDCIQHHCTISLYIGEICRYVLAQPPRPEDTQHCVRLVTGVGLRPQIWRPFQQRFQIEQIGEFYASTEGNVNVVNTTNKEGSVGFVPVSLPLPDYITLLKVDPETHKYVRDGKGFCVKAGINEPGEIVGKIEKGMLLRWFLGYKDKTATEKKILRNVFKQGDAYFLSGDILQKDEEGYLYFCDRTGDTFRWKGENVSSAEVESIIATILDLCDVVVYGVEVPGMEGRAGMAAVVGTEQTIDFPKLAQRLHLALPKYAIPVFIRLVDSVDLTGTFKLQKVKLRNEAFDKSVVSDPLYLLDTVNCVYIPFDEEKRQELISGDMRL